MSRPKASSILSIDWGLKRIGFAISDTTKIIASPLGLLEMPQKKSDLVKKVREYIEKVAIDRGVEVETVVVGMPYKLSGEGSSITKQVQEFVEKLKEEISIPVQIWDERFTSKIAEQTLKLTGHNRKNRTNYVDTISATLVLQSYLDAKNFER